MNNRIQCHTLNTAGPSVTTTVVTKGNSDSLDTFL